MKIPLGLLTALAAVAALTAACNPFGSTSSRERLPEDPRFAEFAYKTDGKITVQERTDSFNVRMPTLGATEGHVAAANFPEGRGLPSPDHHFWVTGVATVPADTIQMLTDGAGGNNSLLPGIYPGLYQYVPQDCHFYTVPSDHANDVLHTHRRTISTPTGGRLRSPTSRHLPTATSSSSPARAPPADRAAPTIHCPGLVHAPSMNEALVAACGHATRGKR